MKKPVFVFVMLLLALPGQAQEFERILIPLTASGVPGANGSLWTTRVTLTNHSAEAIQMYGYGPCNVHPCIPDPIPADTTIHPVSVGPFLTVERGRAGDVAVQLRVQDVSRQAETWGTTIPVVREDDVFTAETLNLIDIVQNDDFRSLLRIYDFDPSDDGTSPNRRVLVRIYGVSSGTGGTPVLPDTLLVERHETLGVDSGGPFVRPPMAQLPLWALPQLSAFERLRIEITAATPGLRFWAFVSVTNNDTQHVTAITPDESIQRATR